MEQRAAAGGRNPRAARVSRGGLPGRAQKETGLLPAARAYAGPGATTEWAESLELPSARTVFPPTGPGQQSWCLRFCIPLRCFAPEWAVRTARSLGRSGGACVRVCSAGALGVGWKCQELPSSPLAESFPRVIHHLPRARHASTRNSSRRENRGGGVAAPHMLLRGGRGVAVGGGHGPAAPTQNQCGGAVSWGASSRRANGQGPPTAHYGGSARWRPPTEPELRLGLTWRPAFLSIKSSSIDYIWLNILF